MKKGLIMVLFLVISGFALGEEIEFWNYLTGERKQVLVELAEKYEKESGNKVNVKSIPFDALQGRFFTLVPRGKGPDLLIGPADWIGSFHTNGLLEDIGDMVSNEEKKEHLEMILGNCTYKEKLYGLPVGHHTISLIYNKDMLPVAPQNTKELIELGKQHTNEQEGKYGLVYDKTNYYYHFPWVGGFGGVVLDENNNPTFDSDAQIDALTFVKSLQEDETLIMPEDVDYNTMMTMFRKGQSPMMINGCWIISQLKESGINYGIARIPMVSETGLWPAPPMGAEVLMMSSQSKNKEVTLDFMKYMTSHSSQLTLADYGFLPSRKEVYKDEKLKESQYYEHLMEYRSHVKISVTMPLAPEMNIAVWGEGIGMLGSVFYDDIRAKRAGRIAQKYSMEKIEEWRNELKEEN